MRNDSDKLDTGRGPDALDDQAAARRRLLLKSLGKGTAVVAAASPLASFAAPTMTTNGTMCSVSGFKSSLASRTPGSPLPCGGYGPRRFYTVSSGGTPAAANWPTLAYPAPSGATGPDSLTFRDLFGGTAPTTRVLDILATNSPPDLALFIAAFFTAALAGQGGAMPSGRVALPYTTADVVQQYANGAYNPAVIEFYALVLAAT
jgi:hypothetical protein